MVMMESFIMCIIRVVESPMNFLHSTYQRLKKLRLKKKPVVNDANEDTPIHWVKQS
jgi:hypothetical protein